MDAGTYSGKIKITLIVFGGHDQKAGHETLKSASKISKILRKNWWTQLILCIAMQIQEN